MSKWTLRARHDSQRAEGRRNRICAEEAKHTRWSTFLKAHGKILAASDFFSVEVWTPRGLMTYYVPLVIDIAHRVVQVAGITRRPDEEWMLQISRDLVDEQYGGLAGKKYLRSRLI
jgi:putative transposase